MTGLILCIVFSAAFVHIMRHCQRLGRKMEWVGAWNYIAATVACGVWWALRPDARFGWEEVGFGSIVGFVLAGGYFLINACMRLVGVGISQTFERLSIVVLPVVASIVIWKEFPGKLQVVGLAFTLISLPLLTQGRSGGTVSGSRAKVVVLLFSLLFVTGCGGVAFKGYVELIGSQAEPAFFTLMFAMAGTANVVVAVVVGGRPGGKDILHGIVLGGSNLFSNYFYLGAVAALPGIVVFPTIGAGVVLVSSVAASVLWKERYRGRTLVGMVMAGITLILINIPVK